MIRTCHWTRDAATVRSTYLCPNGPYKSAPLSSRATAPSLLANRRSAITATRCNNNSNDKASPCARPSSHRLLGVCFAVGMSRWLCCCCCIPGTFWIFCSRFRPPVKSLPYRLLPLLLLLLWSVCSVSGLSGGVVRLGGVFLRLVAADSCLLHGRQMFTSSSFLTSVRRFCCRRCRAAFGGILGSYVIIQSAHDVFCHKFGCF